MKRGSRVRILVGQHRGKVAVISSIRMRQPDGVSMFCPYGIRIYGVTLWYAKEEISGFMGQKKVLGES